MAVHHPSPWCVMAQPSASMVWPARQLAGWSGHRPGAIARRGFFNSVHFRPLTLASARLAEAWRRIARLANKNLFWCQAAWRDTRCRIQDADKPRVLADFFRRPFAFLWRAARRRRSSGTSVYGPTLLGGTRNEFKVAVSTQANTMTVNPLNPTSKVTYQT